MISVPPTDLGAELEAIAEIDDLRRQLKWHVADGPRRWYGGLRRLVFAKAVQRSNAIEGYNATTDDVLAAVEDEETVEASMETRLALQGYRDAMTYVVQLADDDNLDVDESLLKSLHFMMLKHDLSKRPGRWRAGDVFVKREPSGEIVYEAPDVLAAPRLIGELMECVNGHDGPLLVRATMAHLNLTMIHPFKDGNGRMARCLQTLVLAREKVVAPVFSSIEEEIGRNPEAYYAVLGDVGGGSWHPENDPRPWIRYCLNCHYRQGQPRSPASTRGRRRLGPLRAIGQRVGTPGPRCRTPVRCLSRSADAQLELPARCSGIGGVPNRPGDGEPRPEGPRERRIAHPPWGDSRSLLPRYA